MGTPITERPRTAFVVTARHAAQRAEFAKTAALFTRVNQQVLEHAQGVDEAEALPPTPTLIGHSRGDARHQAVVIDSVEYHSS